VLFGKVEDILVSRKVALLIRRARDEHELALEHTCRPFLHDASVLQLVLVAAGPGSWRGEMGGNSERKGERPWASLQAAGALQARAGSERAGVATYRISVRHLANVAPEGASSQIATTSANWLTGAPAGAFAAAARLLDFGRGGGGGGALMRTVSPTSKRLPSTMVWYSCRCCFDAVAALAPPLLPPLPPPLPLPLLLLHL